MCVSRRKSKNPLAELEKSPSKNYFYNFCIFIFCEYKHVTIVIHVYPCSVKQSKSDVNN